MALDTDYTSATYDAFSTILEMDAVMAELGVLFTATFWSSLQTADKEALIKASTRYINTLRWKGEQNPDIQVATMQFPRIELEGATDTEVPHEVMLRMGCWIIHNATANGNGSGNISAGAMKSKNVGDVSITYETNADLIKASTTVALDPCETYAKMFILEDSLSFGIGGVSLGRRA